MFRVEIIPGGDAKWVDHEGTGIEKLVFSKEYQSSYVPGHYPLESFGSLYRNIDNFRESPLQSRTDWEIRVPSVYSSADGKRSFVDLLYELEAVNIEKTGEFDLIGCKAVLYDDDIKIYMGMVESVSSGARALSLRISDMLGNPKSPKRQFPIAVGNGELDKWPVVVTKEKGRFNLEISSVPMKRAPKLFIKIEDGVYKEILNFLRDDNYFGLWIQSFDSGWMNLTVTQTPRNASVMHTLQKDIGKDDFVLLPARHVWNDFFVGDMYVYFRIDKKDTPNYFSIGEGDDYEILEAWSQNDTPSGDFYSLGREHNRKWHGAGSKIKTIPPDLLPDDFRLIFNADAYAESVVMDEDRAAAFQVGNPAELAFRSREWLEEDDRPAGITNWIAPHLTFKMKGHQGDWWKKDKKEFNFTINLACPDVPGSVGLFKSHTQKIRLALIYSLPKGNSAFCKIGDYKITLPLEMDGKVKEFTAVFDGNLSQRLSIAFTFSLYPDFNDSSFTVDLLYARARYSAFVPLGSAKIYASGTFADFNGNGDSSFSEKESVESVIQGLLTATGGRVDTLKGIQREGAGNAFLYGGILDGNAFAFRDKLRALAAESATLVRFSPHTNRIVVSDISMQEDSRNIVPIPLSALVREGGIYSFKMESPDRSEFISELSIYWGKDPEKKEYAHVLSASPKGILVDGENQALADAEKWQRIFGYMQRNRDKGVGISKTVESEWITSREGAENMAYNLLRWNTAPMRKADARCIFTELNNLEGGVDIGTFVSFELLPGYHKKISETVWVVTGRHDDIDAMISTLELLEAKDLPAAPHKGFLLLEDGRNILLEDNQKIKLEDFYYG
jgi:hypothetical protein